MAMCCVALPSPDLGNLAIRFFVFLFSESRIAPSLVCPQFVHYVRFESPTVIVHAGSRTKKCQPAQAPAEDG